MKSASSIRASLILTAFCLIFAQTEVTAHPGRTAADGCHNDRKNGGRHCHGGARPAQQRQANVYGSGQSSVYYMNCTAARNAGAAPIRRGEPGYASHLDRDNDGIGCE